MNERISLGLSINSAGCIQLPPADRIRGIALIGNKDTKLSEGSLQYSSAQTKKWCEIRMPLSGALYLLTLLKALAAELG